VHTATGVFRGRIDGSVLRAWTENFGELAFKFADLYALESLAAHAELSVTADTFHLPIPWHDTGIKVESGKDLVIRATGRIEHPQAHLYVGGFGLQLVTGPEGSIVAHNKAVGAGSLVGKIGEQGDFFVIGKHFEAKLIQSGRLYLFVVPWQKGDNKPSGCYRVKVNTGANLAPGAKPLQPAKHTKQELETLAKPVYELREKMTRDIISWMHQMEAPGFDPKNKDWYEQSIRNHVAKIEKLATELQNGIGSLLPGQWLEDPVVNPMVDYRFLFR
jgi:hypothetical protein